MLHLHAAAEVHPAGADDGRGHDGRPGHHGEVRQARLEGQDPSLVVD